MATSNPPWCPNFTGVQFTNKKIITKKRKDLIMYANGNGYFKNTQA